MFVRREAPGGCRSVIKAPESPDAFKNASWADVVPYYEELASRPLDVGNVETWLADWSLLEALVTEAASLAHFAYVCDTADPQLEAAHLRFGTEIGPKADEQGIRLQTRLVELGYVRPGLEGVVQRFRNQMQLFDERNVPLFAQLTEMTAHWSKVSGAMTVDWDGAEKTPDQLRPYLEHPDRDVRERAFKGRAKPYLERRDELAGIFEGMYDVRQQVAANAGFANFRDFTHREKNRFDYTPDDCLRFHEAVEEVVTPAVQRILGRRRSEMGLTELRPWDLEVDQKGGPPLRPFQDITTLIDRAGDVFYHVEPDFRGYYRQMADANLLDLENRKGKAPGGFCDTLAFRKLPLIFMNAVGINGDVRTLLHESGHAFHAFAASQQPLVFERFPGHEMAEVASMSMELLADPFLDVDHGGYYTPGEARRSRAQLLEAIVLFFPHCASVDAFQHWTYIDKNGRDRDARDQKWLELRRRFEGEAVDWRGLDSERIARWYQQPHFFSSPFYYIEYGIAQLGALQIWRNSLHDRREAVRKYRVALSLGATRSLPELFAAAGARLIFDSQGIRELVSLVEDELAAAVA